MKLKIIMLNLISVGLMLISSELLALQFAIDNYSRFANLSYNYSFDEKDWTWCAFLPAVSQNPMSFVKLPFTPTLPISWKLEATNGKRLQCTDYHTHQPTPSIITLNNKAYTETDMLLLDVLEKENSSDKFFAQIIDLDGEKEYSNTIECSYPK